MPSNVVVSTIKENINAASDRIDDPTACRVFWERVNVLAGREPIGVSRAIGCVLKVLRMESKRLRAW